MAPVDDVVTHHHKLVGDVRLHWVEAGEGDLVVLLHGFPEFWYSWRHQIPALAEAGFRVVAPDMRGYNVSDKPSGYEAYLTGPLSDDVAALITACGEDRATVVGHDWGGAVAWVTAMRHPEVVERLVIVNCPHPAVFKRELRNPRQVIRSSYMLAFQLPLLAEAWLRGRQFAGLRRTLRFGAHNPAAFTDDDLDRYAEAFSQPGALTAALAYYRAMGRRMAGAIRQSGAGRQRRVITAPTLIIWGRHDAVLGRRMADPGPQLVPNRRVELIDGAAHFVQADAPERVNELLIQFARTTRP